METASQLLHRLNDADADRGWDVRNPDPRIVQDFEVRDPARRTRFWKAYEQQLGVVPLPTDLPSTAESTVDVLAGAPVAARQLDLAQLARLLFLSAGVVRTIERPFGMMPFRAAGSAGSSRRVARAA